MKRRDFVKAGMAAGAGAIAAPAIAAAADMQAKYDARNPAALKRLIAAGAKVKPLPQEVLRASWRAARELYKEMAEKNPDFKKVLDHQFAFRDECYQWWQLSDYSYDRLMIQAYQQKW